MKLLTIFVNLLFFFVFTQQNLIFASDVFIDDFEQISESYWNINLNNGLVESKNNILEISSQNSNSYPFIYNSNSIFPNTEYKVKIRFKFNGSLNYGSGIVFTDQLLPNSSPYELEPKDAIFQIWPESSSKYSIWTTLCETLSSNDQCLPSYKRLFSFSADTYQELEITKIENSYNIKINGTELNKIYKATRDLKYVWFGSPQITQTGTIRPKLFIDYIKVESLEQRKPVVILPGFGGSWDVDAVLRGVSGNKWSVPEFVKEYDGLKNSLINAGYKEDEDLFIFAYDWRKNLDTLADDLKAFLTEKDLDNKEINLIGHSMGGLVARSYLQKHNNEKIKVVTVGTPHKGILDAYGMWEGLTVWDAVWWQKALHFIATEVNRNPGEMKIEAARRNAPSIKDLLPTWQFLSVNGVPKSTEQMIWKNDFLLEKNSQIDSYLEKLVSGFSQTYQTKTALSATKQTAEDKLLGLWDDGKPILKNPFGFSVGDGYVTSSSSGDLFNKRISLEGGHGEVIAKKENIVKVLQEIGVATESAVGSNFESKKGFLAFKLNSPGKMNVCLANICNENLGIVFEDQKMLIIPDYVNSQYKVEIIADGETGKYNLIAGQVTETANWDKGTGELRSPTQTDKYAFEVKTNDLKPNSETAENNFKLLFPGGINTKKINTIRQEILREIDKAMKNEDVPTFDYQIAKWLALGDYTESVKITELLVGFGFSDLESYSKGLYKAKNLPKTKSYYHEELISLVKKVELALESEKRLSLKALDKKFQLIQLNHFLGHEFRSLF